MTLFSARPPPADRNAPLPIEMPPCTYLPRQGPWVRDRPLTFSTARTRAVHVRYTCAARSHRLASIRPGGGATICCLCHHVTFCSHCLAGAGSASVVGTGLSRSQATPYTTHTTHGQHYCKTRQQMHELCAVGRASGPSLVTLTARAVAGPRRGGGQTPSLGLSKG